MRKSNGKQLAIDIMHRSICSVQVGAAIEDTTGRIVSWGWNGVGSDGLGCHAEYEAIRRSNRKRLDGAFIYVASQRRRNGKIVNSRPCDDCDRIIKKHGLRVWFRNAANLWTRAT